MRLVAFLYILARDYLTIGQIEAIMEKHVELLKSKPKYSSAVLERYAHDLAKRLKAK